MKILRIVATLVTGGTMLVGGVLLTTSGQPAVIALGAVTAAVGAFYAFAGLTVERVMTTARPRHSNPVAAEIADGNTVAASTGLLAGHSSGQTSSARALSLRLRKPVRLLLNEASPSGLVDLVPDRRLRLPGLRLPRVPTAPMSALPLSAGVVPLEPEASLSSRDAAWRPPSTDDLLTSSSSSPATGWFEQLRDATPRS